MKLIGPIATLTIFLVAVLPASAQSSVPAEVTEIAAGWSALAAGRFDEATATAATGLSKYPRSIAAATLLVQSETLRVGAVGGLNAYEQWLGSRPEQPALLRIVALGALREAVRETAAPTPRREAFRALSAEGDGEALVQLAQFANAGGIAELQVLGALGSESATRRLVAAMRAASGDRTREIAALIETRSPLAVAPLVEVLGDENPVNRAASADALGKLGAESAIGALRPLLTETNFSVRFAAARALYRLRDGSGLAMLRTLETSEYPMLRALALEATAADAGPTWTNAVRDLLRDPDPQVRLLSARLIAPYEPAAATAAFEGLLSDENIAIREASAQVFVDEIVTDWGIIRRFLRSPDPMTRVKAADRVLELTRQLR